MPRLSRPARRRTDEPAQAVTPTVPSAILAVLGVLMIVVLLGWLGYDIERQRRIAARQEGRVERLLEAARPTARQASAAVPEVAAGLRRADALVRALRARRSPEAIAAAGDLARSLQQAGAAQAIGQTGRLASTLLAGSRVGTLIDRANRLVDRVQREDTPGDVDATRRITAELLTVTHRLSRSVGTTKVLLRQSLAVQQQTLTALQQSLGIQQELLTHTRNLDRRIALLLPATGPARR